MENEFRDENPEDDKKVITDEEIQDDLLDEQLDQFADIIVALIMNETT